MVVQVEPPIIGKELTSMFMDTLQPIYWEKMIGGVTSSIVDLVTIGGLVEEGLKNGKIAQEASQSSGAKNFGHKKEEGETSVVFNKRGGSHQGRRNNQDYVIVVTPIINTQNASNNP